MVAIPSRLRIVEGEQPSTAAKGRLMLPVLKLNNQPERTMKTEEQQRKEFEEWALDKGYMMKRCKYENTSYMSIATDGVWQAWQAAQDSASKTNNPAVSG